MTKDEADQLWHELGELLACSRLTESQCHEVKRAVINYTTAHAQAAVDAALADTLGLAEEIVKRGLHIYLSTNNGALHVYEENDGLDRLMFYWQGNKRLDRAEAEALLGEGKKE